MRAVIGSALYITLCGLFALAAAAIIRNTAATITAIIGLLFVIPVLVNLLPWHNDLERWLPSSAGRAISATVWEAGPQNSHLFSPWGQFTVFAVYTAVLLVVGGILFRKRDASVAETRNASRRPSTSVSSAVTVTSMPTGLAARCSSLITVPTEVCPGGSPSATAATVASSARASSRGVASTGTSPLPIRSAVSAPLTTVTISARRPAASSTP